MSDFDDGGFDDGSFDDQQGHETADLEEPPVLGWSIEGVDPWEDTEELPGSDSAGPGDEGEVGFDGAPSNVDTDAHPGGLEGGLFGGWLQAHDDLPPPVATGPHHLADTRDLVALWGPRLATVETRPTLDLDLLGLEPRPKSQQ